MPGKVAVPAGCSQQLVALIGGTRRGRLVAGRLRDELVQRWFGAVVAFTWRADPMPAFDMCHRHPQHIRQRQFDADIPLRQVRRDQSPDSLSR